MEWCSERLERHELPRARAEGQGEPRKAEQISDRFIARFAERGPVAALEDIRLLDDLEQEAQDAQQREIHTIARER